MSLDQKRLKILRNNTKLSQKQLADALGVPHGTYRNWEQGLRTPDTETVMKLAEYFNVSTDYIFGRDTGTTTFFDGQHIDNSTNEKSNQYCEKSDISLPANILDIKMKKVPTLDSVITGQLIFSERKDEYYFDIGSDTRASFCMKVKGDSMLNARILDGDYVFIHEDSQVNDGEIAAVLIGDEVFLRRVYKNQNELVLMAENPSYKPMIYRNEELEGIKILGLAVAFQSNIH